MPITFKVVTVNEMTKSNHSQRCFHPPSPLVSPLLFLPLSSLSPSLPSSFYVSFPLIIFISFSFLLCLYSVFQLSLSFILQFLTFTLFFLLVCIFTFSPPSTCLICLFHFQHLPLFSLLLTFYSIFPSLHDKSKYSSEK